MNKREYADYRQTVKWALSGLTGISSGHCPGCDECRKPIDDDGEPFIELWFSKRSCEICGSSLGGDRYPIHAVMEDGEIVHFDACPDCVYYIEYGRLDDTTMADMEA